MADMRRMQVGQVVDFVVSFNERQKAAEREQARAEKRAHRRKATQADIDSFFG